MKSLNIIKKICDDCISEGEIVVSTKWSREDIFASQYVDLEQFKRWQSNCKVLINILNKLAEPWRSELSGEKNNALENVKSMLGALRSIKDTIENGYLLQVEDLIFAEAFSNLIEQAESLFSRNYFLASGVIARAVLEEKLRSICNNHQISFSRASPTLSDYNIELYKSSFYDKISFKHIEYLISIGNAAAHNQPIEKSEVGKMVSGVKDFLVRYAT